MSKVIYRGPRRDAHDNILRPSQKQRMANARHARERYDAELAMMPATRTSGPRAPEKEIARFKRDYPELAAWTDSLDAQLRNIFRQHRK